jgi:hypothetical protein
MVEVHKKIRVVNILKGLLGWKMNLNVLHLQV